jgi:hypothetical protein
MGGKKRSDVSVCLRCGSSDLEHMYGGIGWGLGTPPTNVLCRACGYIGPPFILDDKEDQQRFLEDIKDETDRLKEVKGSPIWGDIRLRNAKLHKWVTFTFLLILTIKGLEISARATFIVLLGSMSLLVFSRLKRS